VLVDGGSKVDVHYYRTPRVLRLGLLPSAVAIT